MKNILNNKLVMTKEEVNNFNQVTFAGFVKNALTMKKLEITVT